VRLTALGHGGGRAPVGASESRRRGGRSLAGASESGWRSGRGDRGEGRGAAVRQAEAGARRAGGRCVCRPLSSE
jgi:hypothetical protein